jgi:hypothetical protein
MSLNFSADVSVSRRVLLLLSGCLSLWHSLPWCITPANVLTPVQMVSASSVAGNCILSTKGVNLVLRLHTMFECVSLSPNVRVVAWGREALHSLCLPLASLSPLNIQQFFARHLSLRRISNQLCHQNIQLTPALPTSVESKSLWSQQKFKSSQKSLACPRLIFIGSDNMEDISQLTPCPRFKHHHEGLPTWDFPTPIACPTKLSRDEHLTGLTGFPVKRRFNTLINTLS